MKYPLNVIEMEFQTVVFGLKPVICTTRARARVKEAPNKRKRGNRAKTAVNRPDESNTGSAGVGADIGSTYIRVYIGYS